MSRKKGETMGERIRRLRDAAKMTQEELSQRGGIPLGSLQKWEQDKRLPRIDHAVQLARALGVTMDELTGFDEPQAARQKRR
jgi:transcriptional regulator with XRE-family HTH domain